MDKQEKSRKPFQLGNLSSPGLESFNCIFWSIFQSFYKFVMTCLLGKCMEKALEVPLMHQKFILRSFFFNKIESKKV